MYEVKHFVKKKGKIVVKKEVQGDEVLCMYYF